MTRFGWFAGVVACLVIGACGGSPKTAVKPDDSKDEMKRDPVTTEETAPDDGTGDSSDPEKEGEDDGANPCGGY